VGVGGVLDNAKVVFRGDREDGYDIADWLEEGNDFVDLPDYEIEETDLPNRAVGYSDLFGYHEEEELRWLADDMIPAKKITLLFGRSKIGKSAMALYIASAVSNQRQPFTNKDLESSSPILS